ncbi:MAG: hypothetical protein WBO35_06140 [Candidatus Saccharimonadales bacterium]
MVPLLDTLELHLFLRSVIKKSGLSQGRVADRLTIDRSRFSRFLNGKEAIPAYLIDWMSNCIPLDSATYAHAKLLYEINVAKNKIEENFDKISSELQLISPIELTKSLLLISKELADSNITHNQNEKLHDLVKNLNYSLIVINWIRTLLKKEQPILTKLTAPIHIKYPFNKMVGALITADSDSLLKPHIKNDNFLKDMIISNFRNEVCQNNNSIEKQHSIYMLARYGGYDDFKLATSYSISKDILIKRMAVFGTLFSEEKNEAGSKILYLIDSDKVFEKAVLFFDMMHYHDAPFKENLFSLKTEISCENTIKHTLNYLKNGKQDILFDINLRKLISILQNFGESSFKKPAYRNHMKDILKICIEKNEKSHIKEIFVSNFKPILITKK